MLAVAPPHSDFTVHQTELRRHITVPKNAAIVPEDVAVGQETNFHRQIMAMSLSRGRL